MKLPINQTGALTQIKPV